MKPASFFRTVQAKLIIVYMLLILIAMQLIGVYFVSAMKNSLTSNFTNDLQEQAELLSVMAADKLGDDIEEGKNSVESLGVIVNNLFNLSGVEIQVLDASGKVLITSLSSHADYVGRKNTQTVVSRALQGISDNEEYVIDEDNERKRVVAKPIINNSKIVGAIYIVASMTELHDTIGRVNNIFISGMLLALGLTAILGVILAHTITQPIKEMTRHATAVAEGNFEQRMPVFGNDEIGQLSEAFNYMTSRLSDALLQNEEEKEKLASILTNMSDGVIATDEAGHVILMNRRASAMLSLDEDESDQKDIVQLLGLDSEQAHAVADGSMNSALLEMSIPGVDTAYKVRVTFTSIHRREFGIAGTIVVLQDVTEQEKLEASRREFVANVSHELRTPLTTIKSYTEALDDGAIEDTQLAQRFVGVIQNETERMIRLVTDLLHLSRLDNKESSLRKEPTDVLEMLEDVTDRFSFQMQQKHIKSNIIVQEGIESVLFDRDQIDQVLDNLVSNSLKYTPDGGLVTLEARLTDDYQLAISVQDTGIGIPKKDIDHIFDRFYRVDKARSRNMGGTGLGLSIAREIVNAHGGIMTLQSELEQGTKVSFILPIVEDGGVMV
ncbi:cell wall metabolism sensor histidine kinase WalK [Paenibacillus crassostreae]|uniref:histidine kinase n=1 Tax=Paenibacillus crassostreae TaxID=1763538 RepID=A0A167BFA5_9BACL|nr:cell wall metabolism sensor histidine kinase WalK [Paenibacillus crassostreae]AOZ92890.1 cell wall metabolism sensor histidine kinase WalK [Paenibacillus crassostreae]OAB72020.1 PAS domain-containing sensor histidine kinase [Paenibacillus crassostreae]